MVRTIEVTHFTDPGCPWAYSASPAIATLRCRYGDQLRWTLVTIGPAEDFTQYAERGYTPKRSAIGYTTFRRFGMPFQIALNARLSATSPACRAVVAMRVAAPAALFLHQRGGRLSVKGAHDIISTIATAAGLEFLDIDHRGQMTPARRRRRSTCGPTLQALSDDDTPPSRRAAGLLAVSAHRGCTPGTTDCGRTLSTGAARPLQLGPRTWKERISPRIRLLT